jgi:stage V sporulation protein G
LTQCSMPEKLRSVSDDDVSNVPVEVRLLRVQKVTGRGTLKCLFDVQIDIQGVEIEVRGFQGRELRGAISIRAPQFRAGDGRWRPALILPDAVMSAIGDAFIEEIGRPELAGRGVSGK